MSPLVVPLPFSNIINYLSLNQSIGQDALEAQREFQKCDKETIYFSSSNVWVIKSICLKCAQTYFSCFVIVIFHIWVAVVSYVIVIQVGRWGKAT